MRLSVECRSKNFNVHQSQPEIQCQILSTKLANSLGLKIPITWYQGYTETSALSGLLHIRNFHHNNTQNKVMLKYLPAFAPNVIYSSVLIMLRYLKKITVWVFVKMTLKLKYLPFISDVELQSSNWVGFDIQAGTSPGSESYENYIIMNVLVIVITVPLFPTDFIHWNLATKPIDSLWLNDWSNLTECRHLVKHFGLLIFDHWVIPKRKKIKI